MKLSKKFTWDLYQTCDLEKIISWNFFDENSHLDWNLLKKGTKNIIKKWLLNSLFSLSVKNIFKKK